MTDVQGTLFCCALGLSASLMSLRPTEGLKVPTPKVAENWGIERIHAPQAWKQERGNREVVVAIIDTGCDVNHKALSRNIWHNPGELGLDSRGHLKQSNGIDDDANGFVDDFQGWNFSDDSNDVSDDHGHGTHVAGIVGGSEGVAPRVSLMILKYYNPRAPALANVVNTVQAIRYAVKMGADVINYSAGGGVKSLAELEALKEAASKGVLVVAAAGNEGNNSDILPFYPADYGLPNILSVTAVDEDDELLRSSNYGPHSVMVAAPGKNIYSTLPNDKHGFFTGTSQATAFATGVAALLISQHSEFRNPTHLIEHLIKNSAPRLTLVNKIRSSGVLDAQMALQNHGFQVTERERHANAY